MNTKSASQSNNASSGTNKIIFFEPYALASPHFETALELMQIHSDQGDKLYIYQCNASLSFCDSNPNHRQEVCRSCMNRGANGLKLISDRLIRRRSFLRLSRKEQYTIENTSYSFLDINELKKLEFDGIDIGAAAASSLISMLRDPLPDCKIHRDLINNIIRSSLKVYFSFNRLLTKLKPAVVYIFNGRFANLRVVLRLCQRNSVECRIHERGSSKSKFSITHNVLPHNIKPFAERAKSFWNDFQAGYAREAIAREFYNNQKRGVETGGASFTSGQQLDCLPSQWDASKRNIVVFNSSEDELASIGDEFHCHPFKNQLEALRFLKEQFQGSKKIDIYLRIHPNLENVDNLSIQNLDSLASSNFHVIKPSSPVSTYKLIDECDAVLTFGSTAGIEATYWGKPSILIGSSFYETFHAAYQISTKTELIDALYSYSEVMPIEGALIYGLYMSEFGVRFKYYQPQTLFTGLFNGISISSENTNLRIAEKMRRLMSHLKMYSPFASL